MCIRKHPLTFALAAFLGMFESANLLATRHSHSVALPPCMCSRMFDTSSRLFAFDWRATLSTRTHAPSLPKSPTRNRARSVSPRKRAKGKVDCGKSKYDSRVVGGGAYFGRRGHLREAMHSPQKKDPPRAGAGISASSAEAFSGPTAVELREVVEPGRPRHGRRTTEITQKQAFKLG